MTTKQKAKEKAIKLRKEGFSYNEILRQVPVAKSTISLWLRSVGLSEKQKQRLTEKKIKAALRGALSRKKQRIELVQKIKKDAVKDVGSDISQRELWLIGTALYWAEGSKEKEEKPGLGISFINSDPFMIKFFLNWLLKILKLPNKRIKFEIYIHENHKVRLPSIIKYWANITNFNESCFSTVYFKKNKIKTKRKNVGNNYQGLLRIKASASSSLNRKISGWIDGINNYYWGVV